MNLQITLDDPNAAREAVWLNNWIEEHELDGVESHVMEEDTLEGTMGGGVLEGVLALIVTEGLTGTISNLLELIFNGFASRQKEVSFVLKAQCPESGAEFEIKVDKSTAVHRDAITKEFKQRYSEICG